MMPSLTKLTSPQFIHRGVEISKEVNASGVGKKLAEFKTALREKEWPQIEQLRNDVEAFASQARRCPPLPRAPPPRRLLPPS